MGLFGDLMKGLGQALGEGALALDWLRTYEDDGMELLQIKIRNFLRDASPELRTKIKNSLAMQCGNATEGRKMSAIYAVYCNEMSNYE